MRLIDTLLGRSERLMIDGGYGGFGGGNYVLSSYSAPDNEKIQPTFGNACEAYSNSGVVFGVVLARMSLFSEAEFKWQRQSDKGLFGSPDLQLLEEPWPGGTTGELLARMEQDVSLAGNAFIRRVNDFQLERLRPDWVTIVSEVVRDPQNDTEVRQVVGYYYEPPTNDARAADYYDVADVAHWSPYPDPLASFRGMSWLTPVLREVVADLQMTDYKRSYLENAATPNMIIKYASRLGDDKVKRIRDLINARHTGPKNAFKTMLLDEGADPMMVGGTFKSMEYSDVQAAGENRIAVAAGVPSIVAGLQEGLRDGNYAAYDASMRRFADLTMRPLWRSATAALAKLVAVPTGARLWYDEAGIAALRQGEKEQADTMQVLATAANTLVMAGYTPDSIQAALSAGDVTLLKHSGLVSVQMQALQQQKEAQVQPVTDSSLQVKVPKTTGTQESPA